MEFDLRLVNGSSVSGRVEIKVKNTWGTVCGRDFTRNEAAVICRHLNYHAGISMAAGHFGPGTGDIILSGIECAGYIRLRLDCSCTEVTHYFFTDLKLSSKRQFFTF